VGSNDVWVSTRPTRNGAWSTPLNVVALNSPVDDIPRLNIYAAPVDPR
jgi:hypothetical protein